MSMLVLGLFLIIVAAILFGQPLYVLIGSISVYCLLCFTEPAVEFGNLDSPVLEATRQLFDNPVLLAIPFFIVAGALMTEGDIAKRLINFAKALFGWLPGGLAVAAVCACIFFAAISGSSPVTVIAIGTIMYPALLQERYPDRFANGLVTSAGSLGILIPPSVPMIVYSIVDPTQFKAPCGYELGAQGELDVGDLFLAGIGPGILIGVSLSAYAVYIGVTRKIPVVPFDLSELWRAFKEGFWALLMPLIILGGIYSALFTPTQAAAVSVVYAFVVELWIHQSIKLEDVPDILGKCAVLMGSLLLIMAMALAFNDFLSNEGIPEMAVEVIKGWNLSLLSFLLIVNVLLLIVGCLMDIISAILILVPLLALLGAGVGVHPMHLAIVFIVNLEIGYLTPPVGLNLFVSSTIFKKKLGEVVMAVVPFLGIMLACLVLITYIPAIALGPVAFFRGKDVMVTFPDREALEACKETNKEVKSEIELLMEKAKAEEEEAEQQEGGGDLGGNPNLLDDDGGGDLGGNPNLLDDDSAEGDLGGDPNLLDDDGGGDKGGSGDFGGDPNLLD